MTDVSPLVKVESSGLASASSAAWCHRGNTRATIVVKAEFSFESGTLVQIPAPPVRWDTEMAFRLARAEVLFSGLVHAAQAGDQAQISVQRGAEQLMQLPVAAPPEGGMLLTGRTAPFAPERSQYLHGISPTDLAAPFVELPDEFDPAFFQSAPAGQQLASLAGGDTIVLDHLFPGYQRLMIRLPTAVVTATGQMDNRSVPIHLVQDTLVVDADSRRCTLVWRGRLAATQKDALARSHAVVELSVQEAGHVEGDGAALKPAAGAAALDATVSLGGFLQSDATVAALSNPQAVQPQTAVAAQQGQQAPGAEGQQAPGAEGLAPGAEGQQAPGAEGQQAPGAEGKPPAE